MNRSLLIRSPGQSSLLLLGGLAVASLLSGCESRPRGGVYIARPKKPAGPAPAALPPAPSGPHLADGRYQRVIRPLLTKYGCDSAACHGGFRGGGFFITMPDGRALRDYKALLERIDREHPDKSELVQKMLAKVSHNGGRNIDDKSCDYQKILAWIGNGPEPTCTDPPPPDRSARFAREVAPALVTLGCADKSCHGGGPAVVKHLDLSSLLASPPQPEAASRELSRYNPGGYTVWTTAFMRAADASDGIHKQPPADPLSCAYRRLYGFYAKAPEISCELAPAKPPFRPSLEVFTSQVLPTLVRRGCVQGACHGAGAGGMSLVPSEVGQPMAVHDYIVLMARVEDLTKIGDSTLLRTARNQEPHGGGQRLGGKGDCVDEQIVAWLKGQPIKACPPPTPPSYERFVSEMQPTLDKMTCTNAKCHGGAIADFDLKKGAKDPKDLESNYRHVLKQIDYDYAPFSQIMLRMHEVCAYSITMAWIEKKPKPNCIVHDPDPSVFPRRDDSGNVIPEKLEKVPLKTDT